MNEQTNQQTDFADQLITKQDAIKAVKYGALSSATLFGRSDAGMTALRETVRVIEQLPSAQPESCEGCKWENAFGYGECGRCRRRLEDMYERGTCENE